jgi:hypothetical protein
MRRDWRGLPRFCLKTFCAGTAIGLFCFLFLLLAPRGPWFLLVFLVWPTGILMSVDIPRISTADLILLLTILTLANGFLYAFVGATLRMLL